MVLRKETHEIDPVLVQFYPASNGQIGKFVDEVVAASKDDRMNTKRAISADIASTARVQNQNNRIIEACERELRRRDLPEGRRAELIECMSKAAQSTDVECAASREFQREQLSHSHKLPWKLIGISVIIAFGCIGGTALAKATV